MIRRLVTFFIATPVLALLDHLSPLDLLPDTEAADEPMAEWERTVLVNVAAEEVLEDLGELADWAVFAADWEIERRVWFAQGCPSEVRP